MPWASFLSVVDRGREKSQPLTTGAEARSFIASTWLSEPLHASDARSRTVLIPSPLVPADSEVGLLNSTGGTFLPPRYLLEPPCAGNL